MSQGSMTLIIRTAAALALFEQAASVPLKFERWRGSRQLAGQDVWRVVEAFSISE